MVDGFIEAKDKETAIEALKKQGYKPLVVSESKSFNIDILSSKKVKTKDIAIFTRQLSTMISAGVPLNRAFITLQQQTDNKYFKTVIGDVGKQIEGGASIGDALSKYPKVFSDIFINMVVAGEAGGILDDILKRLATQLEKSESIRKKIKSATTYPKVVFGLTIGAFMIIMNVIVPKITAMLFELGGPDAKLPMLTRVMISISNFSKSYAIPIVIVLAVAVFFVRKYLNTPGGKYKYHRLLLMTPILKNVIIKIAIARFARTFSSLMSAGVSVNKALRVTAGSMGNKVLEKELLDAAVDVESGKQLSDSLSKSHHYPPIVPQMITIGEETGQIDKILVRIADFYEEEVDATIEGLSSLLEPLMIVVLGGMVGLVAASVMAPLSSLTNSLAK
ncbi:type II secretion system F family protein [Candidatus Saccharibacteria bacterium]|nr:type II secretion system F family protein [Candidatus Saccharibacteria bacterium]